MYPLFQQPSNILELLRQKLDVLFIVVHHQTLFKPSLT